MYKVFIAKQLAVFKTRHFKIQSKGPCQNTFIDAAGSPQFSVGANPPPLWLTRGVIWSTKLPPLSGQNSYHTPPRGGRPVRRTGCDWKCVLTPPPIQTRYIAIVATRQIFTLMFPPFNSISTAINLSMTPGLDSLDKPRLIQDHRHFDIDFRLSVLDISISLE
jgi:hypothetical protein